MDLALLGIHLGLGISPENIASSVFSFAVKEFEAGVEAAVRDTLGEAMAATTSVGLGNHDAWFNPFAGLLAPVEKLVVAPLLFAATMGAVLRQDMRRLARAWLVCLPAAVIAGAAIVKLSGYALAVTDSLSATIQAQVAPNLGSVFTRALLIGLAASILSNGILGIVLCVVFLLGTLIIWMELALRSASIEIAVFFMPLAFAGLVWPATAHWAKKMVGVLVALMLVKPVIVGTLCLGARALTSFDGFSAGVEGMTILLMAAFAPMAVIKLIPMVEISAVAHLHDLLRAPGAALDRNVSRGSTIANLSPLAERGARAAGAVSGGAGAAASFLVSRFSGRGGGGRGGGTGTPAAPPADPLGAARFPGSSPAGKPALPRPPGDS